MANGQVLWFLGKNLSVVITPQDVSATGIWTDNASGSFTMNGRLDPSDIASQLNTDNILSLSDWQDNPVPLGQGTKFNITEIMQALPLMETSADDVFGKGNTLLSAVLISYYWKVVVHLEDNTPAPIKTMTMYGITESPFGPSFARGKNTNKVEFTCVNKKDTTTGVEIPNPAFS